MLKYIELKSGHNDNGPAWVARVKVSRSGRTVYFNGRALKRAGGGGITGNHYDVDNGQEYWVSGVKKNGLDRHWAGSGLVGIEAAAVPEYLRLVGATQLDSSKLKVIEDLEEPDPSKFHVLENKKSGRRSAVEQGAAAARTVLGGAVKAMQLQTKNLILVLRSTDEVLAWIDSLDAATRAEVSPIWLARVKASTSPDPWAHGFVMMHRDGGGTVGSCAYMGPPDPEGVVEIGYGVDPEHQGKGYATEAAQALVDHAFGSGQVRLVRAHTRLDGEASMKVLTRCGFERTGQVVDPEDGLVWRWEIRDEAATVLPTH